MKLSLELLEDRLAPSATQLVFTTSPQTILAGQPSALITVQLEDQNAQPVQAGPGGVVLNLLSSSPGEMFLDASGNPLPNPGGPSITIAQGASSVSFEYEDSVLEMPTLTVASAGLLSATQQETIFANQVVTNTNDSGPGSLRDAMLHAAAGNTIAFAPSGGGAELLSPLPLISVNLNIVGSSGVPYQEFSGGGLVSVPNVTIVGNDVPVASQGLFSILSGVTVTMSGLEITDSPGAGISNAGNLTLRNMYFVFNRAGAIRNDGTLTVSNSTFGYNTTPTGTGAGGIDNAGGGMVTITNSTIYDSTGPAIDNEAGTVTLTDSTVTENGSAIENYGTMTLTRVAVDVNGQGIYNHGTLTVVSSAITNNSNQPGPSSTLVAAGIDSDAGAVTISDSTIAGNNASQPTSANSTGGIGIYGGTLAISNSTVSQNNTSQTNPGGGGIYAGGTSATIFDTIVAGNTSTQNPTDVAGAFTSLGHNFIGAANSSSMGFVASDIVGTVSNPQDPKLGTLGDNGGPTQTVPLLPGSPAIDAGDNTNAPAFDQRGLPRIVNGTIDIGAYEFQIVVSPNTLPVAQVGAGYSQTIGATYGTAPYTFTVTAGALPVGLSLATDGTLSGTPTAGGTFTFTITATDSSPGSSYSGSQSYSLIVNPPSITISPAAAGAPVNVAYSQQLTASGGTAPYSNFTVSAGQLPPGITLSATGLLSGTPTQAGAFLFTVAVTDSSGGTGPYTTGQQIGIIVTPPGFGYDAADRTLGVNGTAAANSFEYSQATTQDVTGNIHTTSTYTINGVALSVPDSLLAQVDVIAQGNSNTAILVTNDTYIGTDGLEHETYEQVGLGPVFGLLSKYTATGAISTTVSLTGFLTIYAYVGHADTGSVDGIARGENIFVSAGSYSYVTGQGEYYEISGASSVYSYSSNARDQAWHYDTAGLDSFVVAGNAYSYMSGTDNGQTFFNEAQGFNVTYGICTHGQSYAYLIDSPGNDVFAGYAPYSYMSGSDSSGAYFNVAEGFALVYAESFQGGTDFAYNYDPGHNILGGNWIVLT